MRCVAWAGCRSRTRVKQACRHAKDSIQRQHPLSSVFASLRRGMPRPSPACAAEAALARRRPVGRARGKRSPRLTMAIPTVPRPHTETALPCPGICPVVAQTFLSAGSRDIPVPCSNTGDWKVPGTRRLESLRYVVAVHGRKAQQNVGGSLLGKRIRARRCEAKTGEGEPRL
jgi:hypothetical protein